MTTANTVEPQVCLPLKKLDHLGHTTNGHPIFTAKDLTGRLYAVAAVGRGQYPARPESYIFVPTDTELSDEFQANLLSLTSLFNTNPHAPWYLLQQPSQDTNIMPLLRQDTEVRDCPYLPLPPGATPYRD